MGKHAAAGGHQRGTVASHGLIDGDVFRVHVLGFVDQCLLDLRDRAHAQVFEFFLHAADGPEQIDRGGAGLADQVTDFVEVLLQFAAVVALEFLTPKACPWQQTRLWLAHRARSCRGLHLLPARRWCS